MYGLEYLMCFGVPDNKVELLEGGSRLCFPFRSREEGEEHFRLWRESIARWKQADASAIDTSGPQWQSSVAGVKIELFRRPIDVRFPMSFDAFEAIMQTWHRRELWPGQPRGLEQGWDSPWDHGDIRHQLWALLRDFAERHGGEYATQVDIAISEKAAVSPSACYYRPGRADIWIGEYFAGPPDLVAEVMTAASRFLDRGPRQEVYRAAGVPHLWLLEPAREEIEVYELRGGYELTGRYALGDSFACELFPGETISVEQLFDTQRKRHRQSLPIERDPVREWILPPEMPLGLEHFFLLGHPQRRWEIWGNRARSMIAFGSPREAETRLEHFLAEACHWEGMPRPKVIALADDIDQAEVGRFILTRERNVLFLDVAVDARRYRELLAIWSEREVWDWGDDDSRG